MSTRVRSRDGQASHVSVEATLAGFALGASAAALLQRRGGARRRGELVRQTIHAGKVLEDFGGKAARDLSHRSRGLVASMLSALRRDEPWHDVLKERVRARLGRLTSHPRSIEVIAKDGVIELHGAILEPEAKQVIDGVSRVRGVRRVVDHLERHVEPGTVTMLQGGRRRPNELPPVMQRNWSPGIRGVAVTCGAALAAWGYRRRGALGNVAAVAGVWMGLRAATNRGLPALLGIGARPRAIDLHKTITIAAPREEVFSFFRSFENFPRFMTHVRHVRRSAEGRWHWIVDGPAGATIGWDAELSAFVPSEVIAWKTVPGAAIESSGVVRFEDEAARTATRVDIRMSYHPPAGAIGHSFAVLLGVDPKRQMDDDLLQLKSLIERGRVGELTSEELR